MHGVCKHDMHWDDDEMYRDLKFEIKLVKIWWLFLIVGKWKGGVGEKTNFHWIHEMRGKFR